MSSEVSGAGGVTAQVVSLEKARRATPEERPPEAARGPDPGGPAASPEAVDLRASRQVEAARRSLDAVPVVDGERVARVRAALQEGTLDIDPGRVAEKMATLERLLAEKLPV